MRHERKGVLGGERDRGDVFQDFGLNSKIWDAAGSHSFPSKEQQSFDFMAVVTVHSDFVLQLL